MIGLELSDMWRAGFQIFEFGPQVPFINRKGEESLKAEHCFHVSGDWFIRGPDEFTLRASHFHGDRSDGFAKAFYARMDSSPIRIELVKVELDGGLRFACTDGFQIAFLNQPAEAPHQSSGESEGEDGFERWRYLPPEDDLRGHLVLDSNGLKWSR